MTALCRTTIIWLLVASSISLMGAQSDASIEIGMTRDEVIRRWGTPPGKVQGEDKQLLLYPQARVTTQKGVVTEIVWLNSPAKARASSSTTNRSTGPATDGRTKPATPAQPQREQVKRDVGPSTGVVASPRPVKPLERKAAPAAPLERIQGMLKWMFVVALGVIGAAVIAKLSLSHDRKFRESVTGKRIEDGDALNGLLQPDVLSPGLLNALEWKRFEELVCEYFRATGVRAELTQVGPDGGVDVHLFDHGAALPTGYVQCKAWGRDVDVKLIRELFGVMAANAVKSGVFVTTGDFTPAAREFARGRALDLIDGSEFLRRFHALPQAERSRILRHVTRGDYRTPTCPRCDVKMVLRKAPLKRFWGCPNFPRCHTVINIRGITPA